jgi:hypothetical protein
METHISRLVPTIAVSRRALLRTATTAAAGLAGPAGPSGGTSAGPVDHSEHVHLLCDGKKSLGGDGLLG